VDDRQGGGGRDGILLQKELSRNSLGNSGGDLIKQGKATKSLAVESGTGLGFSSLRGWVKTRNHCGGRKSAFKDGDVAENMGEGEGKQKGGEKSKVSAMRDQTPLR